MHRNSSLASKASRAKVVLCLALLLPVLGSQLGAVSNPVTQATAVRAAPVATGLLQLSQLLQWVM